MTPTQVGANHVWVAAVDGAGNVSPVSEYDFLVHAAPPGLDDPAAPYPAVGDGTDELSAVSCPAADVCYAVGTTHSTTDHLAGTHWAGLIEAWSGGVWRPTVVGLPANVTLYRPRIDCVSTASCTVLATGPASLVAVTLAHGSWTARTRALPDPGADDTTLAALSCPDAGTCIAVGSTTHEPGSPQVPFATTLTDHDWTVTDLPAAHVDGAVADSTLNALSCPDAHDCVAIGRYATGGSGSPDAFLTETMRDTTWTAAEPAGGAAGSFGTVSCTGPSACTGTSGLHGLVLDATGWHVSADLPALPDGDAQAGPAFCSGTARCRVMEGRYGEVAVLDGGTWTLQNFPTGNQNLIFGPTALTCRDFQHCAVVGQVGSDRGYVSTLSGSGPWSSQIMPSPSLDVSLDRVSCPTVDWCAALGHTNLRSFVSVLSSHSSTWAYLPVPAGSTDMGRFDDLSCPAAGSCTAVGLVEGDPIRNVSTSVVVDTLAGGTWATAPLPQPDQSDRIVAPVVSCVGAGSCTAAFGVVSQYAQASHLVIDILAGGSWTMQDRDDAAGEVHSMACASTSFCVFVGRTAEYTIDHGVLTSAVLPLPADYDGPDGYVDASSVSCPAEGWCVIVGHYDAGPFQVRSFADTLSDGSWTSVALDQPEQLTEYGLDSYRLVSVSCRAIGACTTVAPTYVVDTAYRQFVSQLSQGSWTDVSVDTPAGGFDPAPQAVSCVAGTSSCLSVGTIGYGTSAIPLVQPLK